VATRKDVIVMHHPDLPGRQITALTDKQAAVYEKSGWKRGEATKGQPATPAATETKGN
jgi:hypothetical protein